MKILAARRARQGLLDKFNVSVRRKPFEHFAAPVLWFSSLRWHPRSTGLVRRDRAQRGKVFPVPGIAGFEFENRKMRRRQNFLADDFRRINADGERGDVMVFVKAEMVKIVDGFARAFGGAVHQRRIDAATGGRRHGRKIFQPRHAAREYHQMRIGSHPRAGKIRGPRRAFLYKSRRAPLRRDP